MKRAPLLLALLLAMPLSRAAGEDTLSLRVPANTVAIEEEAFYDCELVTDVVIPDGLRFINDRAFYSCNALSSVVVFL